MTDERSRVLTLVFTDLADSTALKTERGDQAVGDLILLHREYVTQLAGECNGRVIDWAGDGCFLTFETSSAAVTFALRLEQTHADHPELPGVRIGVHMGEVTERSGPGEAPRIEGLAVDIAARISGLAKPGQVLMSASVHNSARQRLGVETFGQPILWQAHGTYELKGFDEPMDIREAGVEGIAPLEAPTASEKAKLLRRAEHKRGQTRDTKSERAGGLRWSMAIIAALLIVVGVMAWRLMQPEKDIDGGSATPQAELAPITSLAVLPLDNLMNDPEQDYFADGMTEAITAELSKIKSITVRGRTSAMKYKDSDMTIPEIAAALNAEGVIEGSVLRDGDQVRITVQLIHGSSDTHVWSESYTNTLESVLQLQSEVALAIADALNAELTGDERTRISDAQTLDEVAIEAFLLGDHYLYKRATKEDVETAIEYFQTASQAEPGYADAWAYLGWSYGILAFDGHAPTADVIPQAREALVRALEIDSTNPVAQAGLARISYLYDRQFDQARTRLERALALSPNSHEVHLAMSSLSLTIGDWDDALREVNAALDLDPQNPDVLAEAGWVYMVAEDAQRSRELIDGAREIDPDHRNATEVLVWWLFNQGEFAEAIDRAAELVELTDRGSEALGDYVDAYAFGGETDRALELLEELRAQEDYVSHSDIAWIYVKLGMFDEAFKSLERSVELGERGPLLIRYNPYIPAYERVEGMGRFRTDPRYWNLVERIGFPPLPPEHPGYAEEQAWLARKAAEAEVNAPITRIAVLPFDNMMRDPEQEYFVDGMTEALITEMAQIRSLQVRGRTSVMRYKDTTMSIPEIARELNVDGVIEGSVLREGDEVRITAQLIHGPSDTHRWAGSFDSEVTSVLRLHSNMAITIAEEVQANLTPQERTQIAKARPLNPQAYELYIEGRNLWSERDPQGFRSAIDRFERALELDPEFALAHTGLADAYLTQAEYMEIPLDEALENARPHVDRAIELDPDLSEAYAARGLMRGHMQWDFEGSEADFRRALELSPSDASAHQLYGSLLVWLGRTEEATVLLNRALELDPFSPIIVAWNLENDLRLGDTEGALAQSAEVEREFPDNIRVLRALRRVYSDVGQDEEAERVSKRGYDLKPESLMVILRRARELAEFGRETESRELLSAVLEDLPDAANTSTGIAMVYVQLGDIDEAFSWLDRAFENGDPWYRSLGTGDLDLWTPIRDDPRFEEYRARLHLPELEDAN